MLFAALDTDHCAVRSMMFDTVESNPVPTAGADAGKMCVPGPPAPAAAEPMTDSDCHWPENMKVAAVAAPTDRNVRSQSRIHVTFVFAVVFRARAPVVATAMEPNLARSVKVPGVVTMLEIRPIARMRNA